MKKEIKIFFTAIMFYTRIPVPKSTGFSSENLNKATRYFPLIGIIVGGIGAATLIGANEILSLPISIIISLSVMILTTGAFHEDALSDFCDGFGGGYTKEQILSIMKDSRIGTYGALSLVVLVLSKVFLLSEFKTTDLPFIIIAAHSVSRINPVFLIFTSQYVRDDDSGKSKPVGERTSVFTLIFAFLFGVAPLVFVNYYVIPFIFLSLALVFIYFRYYVKKKIGGYTGDVLGALQQFSEIGFYITYLIVDTILI